MFFINSRTKILEPPLLRPIQKLFESQIILSQILAIQNSNHTQEHKIYVKNLFSLKGKTIGQT